MKFVAKPKRKIEVWRGFPMILRIKGVGIVLPSLSWRMDRSAIIRNTGQKVCKFLTGS